VGIKLHFIMEDLKQRLHGEERGAAAVEYGLIVALIALAITAGAIALGDGLDNLFSSAADELGSAAE